MSERPADSRPLSAEEVAALERADFMLKRFEQMVEGVRAAMARGDAPAVRAGIEQLERMLPLAESAQAEQELALKRLGWVPATQKQKNGPG